MHTYMCLCDHTTIRDPEFATRELGVEYPPWGVASFTSGLASVSPMRTKSKAQTWEGSLSRDEAAGRGLCELSSSAYAHTRPPELATSPAWTSDLNLAGILLGPWVWSFPLTPSSA